MPRKVDSILKPPFNATQSPQNDSPLIGLPTELRTKILRMLLKSDAPLYSKEECKRGLDVVERDKTLSQRVSNKDEDSIKKGEYRKTTSLSSQVLRTCQQLYLEGCEVLYDENTICILIEEELDMIFRNCKVSILDHTLDIPSQLEDIGRKQRDTFRSSLGRGASYPSMDKFGRIRITSSRTSDTIRYGTTETLAMAYRRFAEFCKDKYVDLSFAKDDRILHGREVELYFDLDALRCIRCNSVSLPGNSDKMTRTIQKLTSADIVEDTVLYFRAQKEALADLFGEPDFGQGHHLIEALQDLRKAAWRYDLEHYEKVRKETKTQVQRANNLFFTDQINPYVNARVQREADIDRLWSKE